MKVLEGFDSVCRPSFVVSWIGSEKYRKMGYYPSSFVSLVVMSVAESRIFIALVIVKFYLFADRV